MIYSFRLPLTFAAALALSPAWSAAEDTPRTTEGRSQYSVYAVDSQHLSQQVTASMLLGKTVVDRDAERVGEVHDIDLTAVFTPAVTVTGEVAAQTAVATLLVSIEGKDDVVRIDADQVEFDRSRDRLTVTTAGMDVRSIAAASRTRAASANDDLMNGDQLAPPELATTDPANTIAPVAVAAVPGSGVEVATTGTDVLRIEEALASNKRTSDVADQVGVLSSTDAILITGQVESEEKREQILEVARETTHREVRDLMQVAAE